MRGYTSGWGSWTINDFISGEYKELGLIKTHEWNKKHTAVKRTFYSPDLEKEFWKEFISRNEKQLEGKANAN
jgi:hypothetical protein